MIPTHVQEKLSTCSDAPTLDQWLAERLTEEHKVIYSKLMKARVDNKERFPVDFDELYVQAGYTQKHTAEDKLIKHYIKDDDYLLYENLKRTGQKDSSSEGNESSLMAKRTGRGGQNAKQYMLTLDCAKRFALGAGTAIGQEMRNFFVKTLDAVQDYHTLSLVAAERKRSKVEKHKLLLQQNPPGTRSTYIVDLGWINGVRYAKVGSTDDPHTRISGLRNDLTVAPNKLYFVDIIPSPNNRVVERKFHNHEEMKKHRATLSIRGKNQNETYTMSEDLTFERIARQLRKHTTEQVDNAQAERNHVEASLTLQITLEQERQKTIKETVSPLVAQLVAAGMTGTELKETLAILFKTSCEEKVTEMTGVTEVICTPTLSIEDQEASIVVIKDFIQTRLEYNGTPDAASTYCGIEWTTTSKAFRDYCKDKEIGVTKNLIDKFKKELSKGQTRVNTSRGYRQFIDLVGCEPIESSTEGKYNFRGYFGWRWKGEIPPRPQKQPHYSTLPASTIEITQ